MRFFPSSYYIRPGGVACRATPSRIASIRFPFSARRFQSLLTLAIETSCDDTCVAVLEKNESGAARLLFKKRITSDHREFGGIHPFEAVMGHVHHLAPLVDEAIQALPKCESDQTHDSSPGYLYVAQAKHRLRIPDFISVTRGPGMPANLSVGLSMAKGLATAWQIPLLGIHHMQAHALTPRMFRSLALWEEEAPGSAASTPLPPPVNFPFLSLLVSGGHTLLVKSTSVMEHSIVAETQGTALGNFIDAAARFILPKEVIAESPGVSFGPIFERFAFPPEEELAPEKKLAPEEELVPEEKLAPEDGRTPEDDRTLEDDKTLEDDSAQIDVGKYGRPASLGNYNYSPPLTRGEDSRIYDSGVGWTLTPPLHKPGNRNKMDEFDFAGLKSQAQRIAEDNPDMSANERRHLARAIMAVAFEHVATRVAHVLADMRKKMQEELKQCEPANEDGAPVGPQTPQHMPNLVVSGGVASNQFLLHVLRKFLDVRGFESTHIIAPPIEYCTDNAAMIAWTGMEMWELGWRSTLGIEVIKTWPLDTLKPNQDPLCTEGGYWVPLATTFRQDEVARREELRQRIQREPQVKEQLNIKAPSSAGSNFVEWQTRMNTEVNRLTRKHRLLTRRLANLDKYWALRVSFAERKIQELRRQRLKDEEETMAIRLDDLEERFEMLENMIDKKPKRMVRNPHRKQMGDYPDSLLTYQNEELEQSRHAPQDSSPEPGLIDTILEKYVLQEEEPEQIDSDDSDWDWGWGDVGLEQKTSHEVEQEASHEAEQEASRKVDQEASQEPQTTAAP